MAVIHPRPQRRPTDHCFSGTYAEARSKFLAAAAERGAAIESFVHEKALGAFGEELAIDVALIGRADASNLLILSSGTHGPEGFAGSACQIAALGDEDILSRVEQADLGLLLIHAVNPYGFSWLHRTNEDNIDLNRNFISFDASLPANPGYADLEPLLLSAWPPAPEDEAALAAYTEEHGARKVNGTLSKGQYQSPKGLFYGGAEPAWSNRTIRSILRKYASRTQRLAWIDVHTGLGPHGHGEKIFPGKPADAPLARSWWGADLMVIAEDQSLVTGASGPMLKSVYEECPQARAAIMALEFGTVPHDTTLGGLRADAWMRSRHDVPVALRNSIRQQLRDVFYCDDDQWKGMVLGQSRVILLQTVIGMTSTVDAGA